MPAAIVLLDTETQETDVDYDPARKRLVLFFGKARYIRLRKGRFCNCDEITFTKAVDFWKWLLPYLHRKTSTWLFAHNLAFDLTIVDFWQLLEAGILTFANPLRKVKTDEFGTEPARPAKALFVDGDPPSIIGTYSSNGGNLVCVDSLNYFGMSLADLGTLVSLPKLDTPSPQATDSVWHRYCGRDIDILDNAVRRLIEFTKQNNYGRFRWTAASLAMAAYRHRLGDTRINFERPEAVQQLERQAYYGGRVELLKTGNVDCEVFELDVASMYPSVMIDNWFPYALQDTWETNQGAYDARTDPRLFTAAEVLVQSETTSYPFRCRDGTYYCRGSFWTTLCGAELRDAFRSGHIRSVARWARYRMHRLFTEYITHFWSERAKYAASGQRLEEYLCKQMLNSLYGKFGQQSPRWEDCHCDLEPWAWGRRIIRRADTGENIVYRSIAGHVQKQTAAGEHKQSFAAIAAWVTAYARQRMRRLVEIAGARNVFYVVNDALYVNKAGILNLRLAGEVQDGELGKLRAKRYGKDAHFWAANNYRIGNERVLSGVHKKAEHIGGTTYRETVFQRMGDIIADRPQSSVETRMQFKVLVNKVKRSHVDADGWTFPITIHCDKDCHLAAIRNRERLPTLAEFISIR